jgi:5-methylthioadenosine/S-adenosylhomocysteine deaminase
VRVDFNLDILIEHGTLVTVNNNREIIKDGALAIKNGRIVAIGKTKKIARSVKAKKIINAQGKVVIPGLIDTHNHLFQTILKGIGDDRKLINWIRDGLQPAIPFMTPDDIYSAALLGCVEMIKSGTTACVDFMGFPNPRFSEQIVRAYKETGIRGTIARTFLDTGEDFGLVKDQIQSNEEALREVKRLFNEYHGSENGRIRVMTGITTTWLCTEEAMNKARDFASKYKTGLTIHIGETIDEREISLKNHGVTEIEYIDKLGILGPDVIAVHCVWVTDKELEILKRTGTNVSHNPESNMYLASGISPVPKMLSAGVNVALACDGAASNNNLDMIEAMRFAALLHKVGNLDPTVITANQVFEMATINGARALGLGDELGSLEIGKKADIAILDLKKPNTTPVHNVISSIVYCANGDNVDTTIVDGQVVMENGIIRTVNEAKVVEKGQDAAINLIRRSKEK